MTDSEHRIGKLEDTVHNIDKRQETFETYMISRQDSFETFMKNQIKRQDEIIAEIRQSNKELKEKREADNARFDEKFDKLYNQMHNLTIAATVGIAAIVITIILK